MTTTKLPLVGWLKFLNWIEIVVIWPWLSTAVDPLTRKGEWKITLLRLEFELQLFLCPLVAHTTRPLTTHPVLNCRSCKTFGLSKKLFIYKIKIQCKLHKHSNNLGELVACTWHADLHKHSNNLGQLVACTWHADLHTLLKREGKHTVMVDKQNPFYLKTFSFFF